MKIIRNLCTLTLALVLAAGCIPLSASAAGTIIHGIGFVNATSLRLRSSAAATASILDTAVRGECHRSQRRLRCGHLQVRPVVQSQL